MNSRINTIWNIATYLYCCNNHIPAFSEDFYIILRKFDSVVNRTFDTFQVRQLKNNFEDVVSKFRGEIEEVVVTSANNESLQEVINDTFNNFHLRLLFNLEFSKDIVIQKITNMLDSIIQIMSEQSINLTRLRNKHVNSDIEPNILMGLYRMILELEEDINAHNNPQRELARKAGKKSGANRKTFNDRFSNLRDYIENLSMERFFKLIKTKQSFFNELVLEDYRYCKDRGFSANYNNFEQKMREKDCKLFTKKGDLDLSYTYCGKRIIPYLYYGAVRNYITINNIDMNPIAKTWVHKKIIIHMQQ